jgi:hypothetical protein
MYSRLKKVEILAIQLSLLEDENLEFVIFYVMVEHLQLLVDTENTHGVSLCTVIDS